MSIGTEHQILETIQMTAEDNLDIRTITMELSLLGCAGSDTARACAHIEGRTVGAAAQLVVVADEVTAEFGAPVINRRISVTPISLITTACRTDNPLPFAQALDRAGQTVGVDFVGGCSALVGAGATRSDQVLIGSIPEALASTDIVCSLVNIGSTRARTNMSAVAHMDEIARATTGATATADGLGTARLVVFANAMDGNPFMVGAFHGVSQPDTVVSVGISGFGVVERTLREVCGTTFEQYTGAIRRSTFKIIRIGQLVRRTVAERLGVPFGIVDLSLVSTAEIGDSVVVILEELGVESVGAPGITAALSLLNNAVKKGGLMACSLVGGLSGSFIPVPEGINMIYGVQRGSISLPKLGAMTTIYSVSLDMIMIPSDTPATSIASLVTDEAAIGISAGKTTAVRVIPVPGKGMGEPTNFGGLLGWTPILAVSPFSSEAFAARGGRIPTPVRSFGNQGGRNAGRNGGEAQIYRTSTTNNPEFLPPRRPLTLRLCYLHADALGDDRQPAQ